MIGVRPRGAAGARRGAARRLDHGSSVDVAAADVGGDDDDDVGGDDVDDGDDVEGKGKGGEGKEAVGR